LGAIWVPSKYSSVSSCNSSSSWLRNTKIHKTM
jgi:hypothetical protein